MRGMEMSSKTPMEKICRALERDAKLRGEATPGPWNCNEGGGSVVALGGKVSDVVALYVDPHNQPLIAHARNVDLGSCLRIAVEALARHRAFGIYDECGHDHGENDPGVVVVEELDKSYTCEEGLLYRVCEACHTDDGVVNERTEDGVWPCPEAVALAQIAAILPDDPEEK
jgi:hypothetical protein